MPDADVIWLIGMASILGTILWCLLLGVVLVRRSIGSTAGDRQHERSR